MNTSITPSRYSLFSMPAVAVNETVIRKATLNDAQGIFDLVNLGRSEGQLLPRSLPSIRACIGDWVVAEENGRITGVGSLVALSPVLSEVRSLAVAPDQRKNGIGAKIVHALVDMARGRGVPTVFALTRAVAFFEKCGFTVTVKENFPEKVWRDCAGCRVRERCDETAMVLLLKEKI